MAMTREADVQRLNVTLADAPLPDQPVLLNFSGPLLITDDGRGVAKALAERLGELGQTAVLVRMTRDSSNGSAREGYSADLTDADAVSHLLERVKTDVGTVAGLVHLLPLTQPPAGERPEDRCRREVKSLYLLSRALEADLRHQGKEGDAVLLGVTALGGRLGIGSEPLPEDFFAGHGGVLGFTKCLAFEWPEVLVRAVDVDATQAVVEIAEQLLAEMSDRDGPLEVGHTANRRVTTLTMPAPLDQQQRSPNIVLNEESTILVTGGARGITAEVAVELARRFQSRLVLVGRSPLPAEEAAGTAKLHTPAEIKAALMAQMQRQGLTVTPTIVETAYQRLMVDREIRTNLERIRQAGAKVEYHSVDVRQEDAIVELLRSIETRFGGLDGVIHGAGVIEDRLLRDKTPESFERVFSTKVDSTLILARNLNPERLKFLVLFSSIAGRYGNRGQSDYAAANEVLAKLADDANRRWPGRVVSMAWGPWGGVGMVADLEKHLVARGLQLITAETGSRFVVEEIQLGTKDAPEVVIAGGSEKMSRPTRSASTVVS
jgi:NAD(P)-dependent dehydrogenase (short-subunit alcohol dehydrogenase family)